MPFASTSSTLLDHADPVSEAAERIADALGAEPDLCLAFASHHHAAAFDSLGEQIQSRLNPGTLLGCSGESIVATGCEYEETPAISMWAAVLPGTQITPFDLQFERSPDGGVLLGLPDSLPEQWPAGSTLLLLGEPYTFPTDWLLERMNAEQPGVPVLGGNASGASRPGEHVLWRNETAHREGAVAALLHGGSRVRSVVSQGCRPIGRPMVITKAEGQAIHELGGKPSLLQLHGVLEALPPEDRQLLRYGLHLGRVVDEYRETFRAGDFLIRNVMGMDQAAGALVIGDFFRPGQTVQFHLRDAMSASADLRSMLGEAAAQGAPEAALLFSCNGRGTRMFPEPHHDARSIQSVFGDIPLAGLFAAGEAGPIGGKNFLHGMTASVVLFG